MRIGIIGASGFIGKAFIKLAIEHKHEVVGYSRAPRADSDSVTWRVFNDTPDLTHLDAIVNYAGESVAQRWSESKKRQFHASRVGVTETIISQVGQIPPAERPQVLINASAVGYYGDCGEQELNEESPKGAGYLSDLCQEWEQSALKAQSLGLRVVTGRIGIVLGKGGDAWEQMRMIFALGAGGPLGNGRQWMPWVNVADVAGGTLHAIEHPEIEGALNLVSPNPMSNREFTKTLGRHLCRPAIIPAPEFALKLLYGDFGKHILDSYRVYPKRLQETGYEFRSETLLGCLSEIS